MTHDPSLPPRWPTGSSSWTTGPGAGIGGFDEVKQSRIARVRSILAQVLGDIASYDTDLLSSSTGTGAYPEGGSN